MLKALFSYFITMLIGGCIYEDKCCNQSEHILQCYQAYNLFPTPTALLSYLQPMPTLTELLPCLQPMFYPYFIVVMPTTYAIPLLHCCHANNLSYALPLFALLPCPKPMNYGSLLQSYHAYNPCPTLTSLLSCLQPMPYPYCTGTMSTTYALPLLSCYHAYIP